MSVLSFCNIFKNSDFYNKKLQQQKGRPWKVFVLLGPENDFLENLRGTTLAAQPGKRYAVEGAQQ